MQTLLKFLVLGDAHKMSDANLKHEEEASSSSPEQIVHSTNTLDSSHTNVLEMYGK